GEDPLEIGAADGAHAREHEQLPALARPLAHADLERVGPAGATRTEAHAAAADGAQRSRGRAVVEAELRGRRAGEQRQRPAAASGEPARDVRAHGHLLALFDLLGAQIELDPG